MYKHLIRKENHSVKFDMIIDTHWWGFMVGYDYAPLNNAKILKINILCFCIRWLFYSKEERWAE